MRWLALLGVSAALVLGVSCGGQSDDARVENRPETSRWLDLLAHIPDTETTRSMVVINDYERVREQFGITAPDPDAEDEVLTDYLLQLFLADVDAAETRGLRQQGPPGARSFPLALSELRTELGFAFAELDMAAEAPASRGAYSVLRGRFDESRIDDAVRTDPTFSDLLETLSHAGKDYYSWGEDFEINAARTSSVRRLGPALRLAVTGEYAYWTNWTEGIEELIETGAGQRPSLANVDHYQALASALTRLDAFGALFSLETLDHDMGGFGFEPGPALQPYLAHATGVGADSAGTYIVVVLLHGNEEAASTNVQRLEERIDIGVDPLSSRFWREMFDSVDIVSDGRLLLARLHTEEPDLWHAPNYIGLIASE